MIALCMTVYDRPDLLDKALEGLFVTYPCGADMLVVVGDGPKSSDVYNVLEKYQKYFPVSYRIDKRVDNRGIAFATNHSLSIASKLADVLIHIDSDFYVCKAGWAKDIANFLKTHKEVGIAAPDLKGRYMRIVRPEYHEIEYALGMVLAIRTTDYHDIKSFFGTGFFDQDISHQFDPDICYRIRMRGKRIAIIPLGECVNLGEGSGDSSVVTKNSNVCKGGFEFLRKWNLRFTGSFRYKSPAMLRWDEFPLNYIFRKQWLAQFPINENLTQLNAQGHDFDAVTFPISRSKWQLEQTREAIKQNVNLAGADNYGDVDEDLLIGKRAWNVTDRRS